MDLKLRESDAEDSRISINPCTSSTLPLAHQHLACLLLHLQLVGGLAVAMGARLLPRSAPLLAFQSNVFGQGTLYHLC